MTSVELVTTGVAAGGEAVARDGDGRVVFVTGALPGELSTEQGRELIEQVAGFGRPYPILILTGGDCLLRPDIFELVEHANSLGVPVALAPSVTGNWHPATVFSE